MTDFTQLLRLCPPMARTTTHAYRPVFKQVVLHAHQRVWLSWLLCLAASFCTSTLTHASNTSASAAAALKVLAVPLPEDMPNAPAAAPGKTQPGPAARSSITVQKGESIDAVIRRGLPGLPLKEDFLRQALAQANPSIFPKGQTYPVRPGTVLALPSHEELRHMLTAQYPNASALFPKSAPEAPASETSAGPDKRRWVRYP